MTFEEVRKILTRLEDIAESYDLIVLGEVKLNIERISEEHPVFHCLEVKLLKEKNGYEDVVVIFKMDEQQYLPYISLEQCEVIDEASNYIKNTYRDCRDVLRDYLNGKL